MDIEIFKQYGGSTPELSMNGLKTYGRLIDVYDGDTIKVILPAFNSYYKFTLRLNGIDTCEIKSKQNELKDYAIKARNRVLEIITNNNNNINTKKEIKELLESNVYLIWVECLESDKYGRVLANVYKDKDTKSLSNILLEENLAYKYSGKTKLSENEILEIVKK
jgi:endonuclease YncB( thermonuclease family)